MASRNILISLIDKVKGAETRQHISDLASDDNDGALKSINQVFRDVQNLVKEFRPLILAEKGDLNWVVSKDDQDPDSESKYKIYEFSGKLDKDNFEHDASGEIIKNWFELVDIVDNEDFQIMFNKFYAKHTKSAATGLRKFSLDIGKIANIICRLSREMSKKAIVAAKTAKTAKTDKQSSTETKEDKVSSQSAKDISEDNKKSDSEDGKELEFDDFKSEYSNPDTNGSIKLPSKKKAAPKKATPKKPVPKKATPKKAAPKKAASKKVTPKKAAPKKVSSSDKETNETSVVKEDVNDKTSKKSNSKAKSNCDVVEDSIIE